MDTYGCFVVIKPINNPAPIFQFLLLSVAALRFHQTDERWHAGPGESTRFNSNPDLFDATTVRHAFFASDIYGPTDPFKSAPYTSRDHREAKLLSYTLSCEWPDRRTPVPRPGRSSERQRSLSFSNECHVQWLYRFVRGRGSLRQKLRFISRCLGN
jgi:hypothetical protein